MQSVQTEDTQPQRSMILLGSMGDLEMSWEEHNDEEMRALIAQKMAEGFTFFAVKTSAAPMSRRRKLGTIDQLDADVRTVQVPDKDFLRMFEQGKVSFNRTEDKIEESMIVRDPAVAAKTKTVAVRQQQGG
jgi:hypothetical protein